MSLIRKYNLLLRGPILTLVSIIFIWKKWNGICNGNNDLFKFAFLQYSTSLICITTSSYRLRSELWFGFRNKIVKADETHSSCLIFIRIDIGLIRLWHRFGAYCLYRHFSLLFGSNTSNHSFLSKRTWCWWSLDHWLILNVYKSVSI